MANNRPTPDVVVAPTPGVSGSLGHGSVLIAAITSCTNTSNPYVMVAAGLVAKKAIAKGGMKEVLYEGVNTGEKDFSARDRDVARIMPLMSRLLPDTLLEAAADAIGLAVLSHAFDLRMAEQLARRMTAAGVRIEIEAFDTGHLWFAKRLVEEGVLDSPALVQLCMGIPWGAPADTGTMKAMVDNLPQGATWAGFSMSICGRRRCPN